LRATHQDVTTTKRLTHVGYNCGLDIGYDTTTAITHYVGTASQDIDLDITVASSSCPPASAYTADCGANQAWCDSYLSFVPATGILTIGGTNEESFPATVDVSLAINEGEPNAVTVTLTLNLVDPCVNNVVVTLVDPTNWAAAVWITDSNTYAIDSSSALSHVTTPAGADCGGYTVSFALT
jgi:hypothetical protein